VTNGIPLGCSLLLPVGTVTCVQTLKGINHRHNWKQRWFKLTTFSLAYYENEEASKPKGMFAVRYNASFAPCSMGSTHHLPRVVPLRYTSRSIPVHRLGSDLGFCHRLGSDLAFCHRLGTDLAF
jgi:hypothetical protein